MNRNITSQAVIQETALRIGEHFAPERVVLFGSHARGDADEGSDVDLMVLFSDIDNPRDRAAEIYSDLAGCGFAKDILVSTVSRFERYRNVPNTVYWPASREGLVLYERRA
ncbi:MAG: nucleotidyltransferase domain-containing protein [Acidobacteriota bacterium]|nr:nucleotidyltransferase domain-containing protein [Acidobacteriota bacterium]